MKSIATSTLPAMLFAGSVLLVYYFYARLWLTWLIRKIRKKDTAQILTSRIAVFLHGVAAIGIGCFFYAYFVEPYWVQINKISIQTDKLQHAHFRIVQISDTHCDKRIRLEEKLPKIINALNPDVIVFTGDTINRESALPLFQSTLASLQAPLGKFAVTGNCDFAHWSALGLFDGTGFEELRLHQQTVEKDSESIRIVGLAFENGKHHQKLFDILGAENFNLLLYHNTDLMDYIDETPVDLYVCGHTHGGQIALPFYGALTTLSRHGKKYEAGLYQKGKTRLYVNRGIGLEGGWSPRMRFFARPEISVFDIGPISNKEE